MKSTQINVISRIRNCRRMPSTQNQVLCRQPISAWKDFCASQFVATTVGAVLGLWIVPVGSGLSTFSNEPIYQLWIRERTWFLFEWSIIRLLIFNPRLCLSFFFQSLYPSARRISPVGHLNFAGKSHPTITISPWELSRRSKGACPNQYSTNPGPYRWMYASAWGKTDVLWVVTSPNIAFE